MALKLRFSGNYFKTTKTKGNDQNQNNIAPERLCELPRLLITVSPDSHNYIISPGSMVKLPGLPQQSPASFISNCYLRQDIYLSNTSSDTVRKQFIPLSNNWTCQIFSRTGTPSSMHLGHKKNKSMCDRQQTSISVFIFSATISHYTVISEWI